MNYLTTRTILLVLVIAGSALSLPTIAQGRYTVNGTVRDKKTGEVLIGASVSFLETPRSGIVSNGYGFYSISAPKGKYTLIVSFSGYLSDSIPIDLGRNILLPVELVTTGGELTEVVISARKKNDNVTR